MKKIHIVPHSHWDREWYFTLQDTYVLSDFVISDVLNELEKDQTATFCLDGQASVVKDYLNLYPHKKNQIKNLAQTGRLTFGPWYTQTDCLYVNGESIIRNLYYGSYLASQYGGNMKVAYLPDTFGFNAQMPTIVKNCGIDNLIFRRGADYQKIPDMLFKWKGLSSKTVNTVHLMDGYGVGHNLSSTSKYIDSRLNPYIHKVSKLTEAEELLICAGGDQSAVISDLTSKLQVISDYSGIEYIQSTYPHYFDAMTEYFQKTYSGELRDGRYDRVHRTIGGIRYDIKHKNYLIEEKLLKRVEPLIAIGSQFEIEMSPLLLYQAWELLMEGHAHDAMGGCVTDNVAKQIIDRFDKAEEIADGIENYIKYRISEKLGLNDNQLLVFNLDCKPFRGIKQVEFLSKNPNSTIVDNPFIKLTQEDFEGKQDLLIEAVEGHVFVNEDPYYKITGELTCELPAFGFKIFEIDHQNSIANNWLAVNQTKIETEFYCFDFSSGITVTNKATNFTIDQLLTFEDCGNDGDTYDFSPLSGDQPHTLTPKLVEISQLNDNYIIKLIAQKDLPAALSERIQGEVYKTLKIEIELSISNSKRIDCRLKVHNNILSHRLRAVLNSNIHTTESISAVPFGYLRRPIIEEEIISHSGFAETPIDIHPTDNFVALSNQNSLYIVTSGIKEYQAKNNKIYLTLLSTTSQLGKPNLAYRPGRASGDTTKQGHVMIDTPLAEQLGINHFDFALALDSKPFNETQANQFCSEFQAQSVAYQKQTLNKFINRLDNKIMPAENITTQTLNEYSLFEIISDCQLVSFSPSLTSKNSYLLRLANPTHSPLKLDLQGLKYQYQVVDACENLVDQSLEVGAYDFITLKVRLES